MTPEGAVKRDIKKALATLGLQQAGGRPVADPSVGWYYMPANNGMGAGGLPDFMGVYKTIPWGIEAKATGKKAAPLQEARRNEMLPAGYIWFLVDGTTVGQVGSLLETAAKEKLNGRN